MAYAEGTTVPVNKSKNEVERLLRKFGAEQFAYVSGSDKALIVFSAHGRQVRFVVSIPDPSSFTRTPSGRIRTKTQAQSQYEAEIRRLWRSLVLMVKAKIDAIESGIATFDEEFLPYVVLPDGKTVFEETAGAIEAAYATGRVRPILQIEG